MEYNRRRRIIWQVANRKPWFVAHQRGDIRVQHIRVQQLELLPKALLQQFAEAAVLLNRGEI
ncbi:hypothetical protein SDC9_178815 [bioreactor metagenome]|uniref:Uncharacterized protein n=1 Tax=bioreactor metagenome TaxID=1076179 RepID=A0A645GWS1_9ZZZZ